MQTRSTGYILAALALIAAVVLSACGAGPAAQAQPGGPPTDILPTPIPMPTSPPRPPTATPQPAPGAGQPGAQTLAESDFATSAALRSWRVIDGTDVLRAPSIWEVNGGRLAQVSDADGNPSLYTTALVTGDNAWKNYVARVAAYNTGNDEMGVVVRASEQGYYVFRFLPDTAGKTTRYLSYFDAASYSMTDLAKADGPGFAAKRWYELSVRVAGDLIQVTIDGQPALEARDTTLTAGGAGVYGYAQGNLLFDNFAVQALPNSR